MRNVLLGLIAGLLLGGLIVYIWKKAPSFAGTTYSWAANDDSVGNIVSGKNFVTITKKYTSEVALDKNFFLPITGANAVGMLQHYNDEIKPQLKPNRDDRTFCVTYPYKDLTDYLAALSKPVSFVRLYFGAYNKDFNDVDHKIDKLGIFVVAVDSNLNEIDNGFTSTGAAMSPKLTGALDLGSLCPTKCPAADPGSIYAQSKLP